MKSIRVYLAIVVQTFILINPATSESILSPYNSPINIPIVNSTNLTQNIDAFTVNSEKIREDAKNITVRFMSAKNGGSGVVIAKKSTTSQGNFTYLVLTNKHIINNNGLNKFQIQTADQKIHTAKLITNTGFNTNYDIALLQFSSSEQYQLPNLKDGSTLEDRSIYSAGFPSNSDKLSFSTGQVSQISDIPLNDGTQIGYTLDRGQKYIIQGMNGGPIIDNRGILIGINSIHYAPNIFNYTYADGSKPTTNKISQSVNVNWGFPIYNFLIQLNSNLLYDYNNLPKVQRQITPIGYMANLNFKTRQQTVRIESGGENGSGVIVAKEGNTYYALTAKHVVQDKNSRQLHSNLKIITYDQERYPVNLRDITFTIKDDIAIVKFRTDITYPIAQLGDYKHGDSDLVSVGGFPDRIKIGSPLWQWQLNPGYIYNKEIGRFVTQDKLSFAEGYDLIYSSISYGGMSGGPIVDTQGKVIGIHGKAEQTDGTILGNSLGISINKIIEKADELKIKTQLLKIVNNAPPKLNQEQLGSIEVVMRSISQPEKDSTGEQWLAYGNQLYRTRQYTEAIAAFDFAIQKGQNHHLTGNYGKSLSLLRLGKNNEALIAVSKAINAIPKGRRERYYYLWKHESIVLVYLGKFDLAVRAIDMAIKLEPTDPALKTARAIFVSIFQSD